jgi:hypothetical protein
MDHTDTRFCNVDWVELAQDRPNGGAEASSNVIQYRPNTNDFCIVGGGIKVHSTLRPLNGLLCQPRVIMIMEKSVE